MNFKEHLQFLAMLIPTLLLLAAATVSLTFPAGRVAAAEGAIVHVMVRTELGPVAGAEAR